MNYDETSATKGDTDNEKPPGGDKNYDDMPSSERKSVLDSIVITHPKFVEAFLFIKRHHGNYRPTKKGNCKFLVGPTGAGKSVPLEQYAARFPAEDGHGGKIRRVVYVSLPPRSTLKSVAVAILGELGIEAVESWGYTKLLRLVVHHLKAQKVELLIIDEFQHCVEGLTDIRQWEGADLVKEVMDKSRCQVLCAGLSDAANARIVNPQLGRRNESVLELTPYDWNNEQERSDFQKALKEVDAQLPFAERAGLHEEPFLNGIHIAADGLFGLAMDLLKFTSQDVIDDQNPMITREHLYRFYRGWKSAPDDRNPFKHDPELVRARVLEDQKKDESPKAAEAPAAVSSHRGAGKRRKRPGHVPKSKIDFSMAAK